MYLTEWVNFLLKINSEKQREASNDNHFQHIYTHNSLNSIPVSPKSSLWGKILLEMPKLYSVLLKNSTILTHDIWGPDGWIDSFHGNPWTAAGNNFYWLHLILTHDALDWSSGSICENGREPFSMVAGHRPLAVRHRWEEKGRWSRAGRIPCYQAKAFTAAAQSPHKSGYWQSGTNKMV